MHIQHVFLLLTGSNSYVTNQSIPNFINSSNVKKIFFINSCWTISVVSRDEAVSFSSYTDYIIFYS